MRQDTRDTYIQYSTCLQHFWCDRVTDSLCSPIVRFLTLTQTQTQRDCEVYPANNLVWRECLGVSVCGGGGAAVTQTLPWLRRKFSLTGSKDSPVSRRSLYFANISIFSRCSTLHSGASSCSTNCRQTTTTYCFFSHELHKGRQETLL